jgi:DNA-binding NarL/FixJ family response regulator
MGVPRDEPRRALELAGFTPAEARVLCLLATYMTLDGIADQLGVRRSTVKTHVVNIYKKLGATSRTQAVELAMQKGFLTPGSGAASRTPRGR